MKLFTLFHSRIELSGGEGGGGQQLPDVQVWYGGVNTWNVCANNTFRKFQLHDSLSLGKLQYVLTV